MWISFLFFNFISLAGTTQSALSYRPQSSSLDSSRQEHQRTLDLNIEYRVQKDLRRRLANNSEEGFHEISLSGQYDFFNDLQFEFDFSTEKVDFQHQFKVNEAFLKWTPWVKNLRFRLGQQYLPVGLFNQRSNWFSTNPGFFRNIFATTNETSDLGLIVEILPLGSPYFFLELGTFLGRTNRSEDGRIGNSVRPPRLLSLKSKSKYHQSFLTHYQHHLAFRDETTAIGAGSEFFLNNALDINPHLLIEVWRTEQEQTFGPKQQSEAFVTYVGLEWWKFAWGYRWSVARSTVTGNETSIQLPDETNHLFMLEFKPVAQMAIRLERVYEVQSEILKNDWVGRALLNWTWK